MNSHSKEGNQTKQVLTIFPGNYLLRTKKMCHVVGYLKLFRGHPKREQGFIGCFSRKGYLTARKTIRRTIYLLRRIVIRKKASDKAFLFWAKTTCVRMTAHADTDLNDSNLSLLRATLHLCLILHSPVFLLLIQFTQTPAAWNYRDASHNIKVSMKLPMGQQHWDFS